MDVALAWPLLMHHPGCRSNSPPTAAGALRARQSPRTTNGHQQAGRFGVEACESDLVADYGAVWTAFGGEQLVILPRAHRSTTSLGGPSGLTTTEPKICHRSGAAITPDSARWHIEFVSGHTTGAGATALGNYCSVRCPHDADLFAASNIALRT
jgi:hypothetical protein